MTDDRLVDRFSGHVHGRFDVMELAGVPVSVSVDRFGTLWVCDLLGGECTQRPLELDAAGPEDEWYFEAGAWDEGDEEDEERPRWELDAYEIASKVTVAHLDGRPVVVTGGGRFDLAGPDLESMGGGVRVWDIRTGRKIGKTLTGHGLGVTSLTTVATESGLLAVSSSEEGDLRAWNLTSGVRVAAIEAGYNGDMGAGLLGGRPVAVTGGHDDFVQVWDLLSGERLGPSLTGVKPVARALAAVEVEGRATVVAGGDGHVLHRWDLESGEELGAPLTGHTDRISALGTARVAGRAIAVTGSNDRTSRIWDLARGEQLGDHLLGHLRAVTEIEGIPVAVTSMSNDRVCVWDLTRAG